MVIYLADFCAMLLEMKLMDGQYYSQAYKHEIVHTQKMGWLCMSFGLYK